MHTLHQNLVHCCLLQSGNNCVNGNGEDGDGGDENGDGGDLVEVLMVGIHQVVVHIVGTHWVVVLMVETHQTMMVLMVGTHQVVMVVMIVKWI